jgi:hypothetical protein
MSDPQQANNFRDAILAEIVLVPLENEEDDFETLSAVEEVTSEVWQEITSIKGYTSRMTSDNTRSAGPILLLGEITRQVIAQKDLLIALFRAGTAAIDVLAQQGRVQKIEVTLDGDCISIENADRATAQTLLAMFEAKHPQRVAAVSSASTLQVTGKVSKRRKRATA